MRLSRLSVSDGHKISRVGPVCSHMHVRSITLTRGPVLAWDLIQVRILVDLGCQGGQGWPPSPLGLSRGQPHPTSLCEGGTQLPQASVWLKACSSGFLGKEGIGSWAAHPGQLKQHLYLPKLSVVSCNGWSMWLACMCEVPVWSLAQEVPLWQ